MIVRLALMLCTAVSLAACDNASTGEPGGPLRSDTAVVPQGDDAANDLAANAGGLPEAGPTPRFAGLWAADDRSCQSAAWRISDAMLRAPDGASCSFNRVTEVEGGYDIQATCTGKGEAMADTLKLRFAEGTQALMVESQSLAKTSLAYCGKPA
ncbi:hypothetical protein H8M03_01290 [Sphingomonas sabuli]|uniref:DUF3617 family protein n=1 Tax=Sphingomonas sabuli TaxID=2764186 RepID=A0A7G9L328_9SPHN|nr:hypothetical protein [Sphingomonas sabuli]QNM83027.1 hypothetical protein H8M03_01290 [Sphingomonas sabuli]